MSPVEKRTSGATIRAVLTMVIALAATIGLAAYLLSGGGGQVDIKLGDERFEVGNAESYAEDISEDGPVFFPDPANGNLGLWLSHIGDDPETGWHAFDFRPDRFDNECTVLWVANEPSPYEDASSDDGKGRAEEARAAGNTNQFVDICNGDLYPATGEGLQQFPVDVSEDLDITVDIRAGLEE